MTALRFLLGLAFVGSLASASAIDRSKPVEFRTFLLDEGLSQTVGPERASLVAIQSKREWRRIWRQMEPRLPREMNQSGPLSLPSIDFNRHTLIVADAGKKPTGGYSIKIRSVVQSSAYVFVLVDEQLPGPSCFVTAAITFPVALVLIERTKKHIRFKSTKTSFSCE